MKKVLILAYDFPPYISVGGIRPYNWFNYLQEFDTYPIVVTRQWGNKHGNYLDYISPGESKDTIIEEHDLGLIIRSPYSPNLSNRLLLKHGESRYRIIRKVNSAFFEFSQFVFPWGTKRGVYKAAKAYLSENKVDAIIATGDPFVLFHYAKKLSRQYKTPWVADYRDPWSHDIHIKRNKLFHSWSRLMEKVTVKSASKITTVNSLLANQIRSLAPNVPIEIIPNGFDPEAVEQARDIAQSNAMLTITFIGRIYEWYPLESFLKVFSDVAPKHRMQLNFYGISNEDELRSIIDTNYVMLKENISIFPKVPNKELLLKIAPDHIMLLFNNYSIMGTKIFDYLGIRRKILLCYSEDAQALDLKKHHFKLDDSGFSEDRLQEDLIRETQSGVIATDEADLRRILIELNDEFDANHKIECNSKNIDLYSRKIQVKRLSEIIATV